MTKCGAVAIVGRPNVGKSTLLNALVGEKISITADKPQTTRWPIWGIDTVAGTQIVYIDTPGLHDDRGQALNRYMNRMANASLQDVSVIVMVVEAMVWTEEDTRVLDICKAAELPIILVLNKIDLLTDKKQVLPFLERAQMHHAFLHLIPLSARLSNNTLALRDELIKLMPESDWIFPEDQLTNRSIRFQCAEFIREKLVRYTQQELPYATAVTIESFEEDDKSVKIAATIWVERPGQKVIVVGKQGRLAKKIGTDARRDMERLIGKKVMLHLWVKVQAGWSSSPGGLHRMGYE